MRGRRKLVFLFVLLSLTAIPVSAGDAASCPGSSGNVSHISFYYGDQGGNLNIQVNHDFRNIDQFSVLNGSTVGGADVTVKENSVTNGIVKLEGNISAFCVGGQELFIDNLTVGTSDVGFDRFDPVKPRYPVNDTFTARPSNVSFSAIPFRFSDGTLETGGELRPSNQTTSKSGGTGQELRSDNANLWVNLSTASQEIDFGFSLLPWLDITGLPAPDASRRLTTEIRGDQLSLAETGQQLSAVEPERSGSIIGQMYLQGERELATEVFRRVDEEQKVLDRLMSEDSAMFQDLVKAGPGMDRIRIEHGVMEELLGERVLSGSELTELSERIERNQDLTGDNGFMLQAQLHRIGSEREGLGEESTRTFLQDNPNVSLVYSSNTSNSSGLQFQSLTLGGVDPLRSGGFHPGIGYDDRVNWKKLGSTAFGAYRGLGASEVGNNADFGYSNGWIFKDVGAITAMAGRGGSGGLWRHQPQSFDEWQHVGRTLDAPFNVVDASVDPNDRNHIFAIAPRTDSEFGLYETVNGGQNWTEVEYFVENETLFDKNGGLGRCMDCARVHAFGNGDVFVYNFDFSDYVFHSDDGGDTWSEAQIDLDEDGTPSVRKVLQFTDNGHGLLVPSAKKVYRTRNYGKNWTKLGEYSDSGGISFGLSRDGSTAYVVYKRGKLFELNSGRKKILNNGSLTQKIRNIFSSNGESLSSSAKLKVDEKNETWKIDDGDSRYWIKNNDGDLKVEQTCCHIDKYGSGTNPNTMDNSKEMPGKGTHATIVDPDDASRLTVFVYMSGPWQSFDSGKDWDRLFNNKKVVGADMSFSTKGLRLNKKPQKAMAKPVDYRDVEVLDRVKDDPILLGSDQGLFLMQPPDKAGKKVELMNVGAMKDHGQVGDVKVDDCGNVYHGLWHHSAMIRPSGTDDVFTYFNRPTGAESGGFSVKDRSNCLGFATKLDMVRGEGSFKFYATKDSGFLQRKRGNGNFSFDVGNGYTDTDTHAPVFFDGQWYVVNRSDNNQLFSATLSGWPSTTDKVKDVRQIAKDKDRNELWFRQGKKLLKKYTSSSTPPVTSLNLSGSDIWVQYFEVHDGRVVAVVQEDKNFDPDDEDVLIYDESSRTGQLEPEDIPEVSNPFGEEINILEVFVDPTSSSRYFATVKNSSDPKCPRHLMVTEDNGKHWERASRQIDCHMVKDMAFNEQTGTAYVATHGRGILEGDVEKLNGAPDVSINLTCNDEVVVESELVTCSLDIDTHNGIRPLWNATTNAIEAELTLPFEGARYEFPQPEPNKTTGVIPRTELQKARCYLRNFRDDSRNITKPSFVNCTTVLTSFPLDSNVTFDIRFLQKYNLSVGENEIPIPIKARLKFTQHPNVPDVHHYNNHDREDMVLVSHPTTDRFESDPSYAPNNGENLSRAIPAYTWSHDPRKQKHYTCPDSLPYPGGNKTLKNLTQAGRNCASLLFDPSQDAPLRAHEIYTQAFDDLSIWTASDINAFNVTLPDLDAKLLNQRMDTPECSVETVQMSTQPERSSSGKPAFQFNLYHGLKDELENETLTANLRQSFNWRLDNITIRKNATVTQVSRRTWHLNSGSHTFIIKDTISLLKVYKQQTTGGSRPKNKTARQPNIDVIWTHEFTMNSSFKQYFVNATPNIYGRENVSDPMRQKFLQNGINLSLEHSAISVPLNRSWNNTTLWTVLDVGETYYVNLTKNDSLDVLTTEQVLVGQLKRNVTLKTQGYLDITAWSEDNHELDRSLGRDDGVDTHKMRPRAYRNDNRTSQVQTEIIRGPEQVTARIRCPRSRKNLSSVLASIGENFRTAGTYNLSLRYVINISRPVDISRKKKDTILGPELDLGQHDQYSFDTSVTGWQDRHIDIEELNRKIVASQIGIKPIPEPEPDPRPVEVSVSTIDSPVSGVPGLDPVLQAESAHPYIQVEHDREFDGGGRLSFKVKESVLEQNGVKSSQVALHRFDNQAEEWNYLETSEEGSSRGYHRYRSEFQGLSLFAVGFNTPPTISPNTGSVTVDEGDTATITGTVSDSENDSVTLNASNGTVTLENDTWSWSFTSSDGPDDSQKITVKATDMHGATSNASFELKVRNVPPSVSATGDRIDEGGEATVSASFTDPGNDTHTADIKWGDGVRTPVPTAESSLSSRHVYGDDGDYTVEVIVTDDDGGKGEDDTTVEVDNLAPEASLDTDGVVVFPSNKNSFLGRINIEQHHSATATDQGSDDLRFNWLQDGTDVYFNDGTAPDPNPSPQGEFPFTATDNTSLTYSSPGVHFVNLTVTDDDSGTSRDSNSKVVTGDATDRQGMGYWRHEYSGRGGTDYDENELVAFREITVHASSIFSEQTDLKSNERASGVFEDVSGPEMRDKAEAQLLAAWLNFGSGSVRWTEMIDTDGDGTEDMTFHSVIDEAESILRDQDSTHQELERAKDLAEAVNQGDEEEDDDADGEEEKPEEDEDSENENPAGKGKGKNSRANPVASLLEMLPF